jgi:hypothetical protein
MQMFQGKHDTRRIELCLPLSKPSIACQMPLHIPAWDQVHYKVNLVFGCKGVLKLREEWVGVLFKYCFLGLYVG